MPGLRVAGAARAVLAGVRVDGRVDGRGDDFSGDAGFAAGFVGGLALFCVAALLAVFLAPFPAFAAEAGGEDFAAFSGGAAPLAGS